jgi:DNA-binding transcriptional regulator LsrR (DeoR family)
MIKRAREQGHVEIAIRTPFYNLYGLETELQVVSGVKEAVVIPRVAESEDSMVFTLGRAGVSYLLDNLKDGDVIAIGGGTTVHAVVQALVTPRQYDVKVVPLVGAVQGRVQTDVNYLATQMAQRLGGQAYQLHAPAFVDSAEQKEALLNMRQINDILDIARQATIALVGIGTVDPVLSRFVQFTALSGAEMYHIATECGGIGEILAVIYDSAGRPCAPEYAERVVGLNLDELGKIPLRVGLAGTETKALPIYGALKGEYLDTIVTDESAAELVLGRYKSDSATK